MKQLFYLLILPVVFSAACSDAGKKEATDALYDQVMAVHDEVMPKMGELMSLKKSLTTRADSLKALGTEEVKALAEQLEGTAAQLENSHQGMMSWMREFNNDFDGMAQEEVLKYLEEQKTKIAEVGKMTEESIQQAKELLNR
jgi:HPt (histidine-containing phosphotransfer) domain-containing protein